MRARAPTVRRRPPRVDPAPSRRRTARRVRGARREVGPRRGGRCALRRARNSPRALSYANNRGRARITARPRPGHDRRTDLASRRPRIGSPGRCNRSIRRHFRTKWHPGRATSAPRAWRGELVRGCSCAGRRLRRRRVLGPHQRRRSGCTLTRDGSLSPARSVYAARRAGGGCQAALGTSVRGDPAGLAVATSRGI